MKVGVKYFLLALFALAQIASAAIDLPSLDARVTDLADILPDRSEQSLNAQLAALEKNTSAQLVVVTLEDLQGYSIEDFGLQLGRHWGIGQAGKDNGILLIIAKKERKLRIEVGYGMEGVITDAYSSYVINSIITPKFKQGDFVGGINAGVDKLIDRINKDPASETHDINKVDQSVYAFFLFPVLVMINILFGRKTDNSLGVLYSAPVAIPLMYWLGGSLITGLILWGLATIISYLALNGDSGGGSGRSYRSNSDSYGYGGYSGGGFYGSSGGGFSGGGGSFGGGGASGSW